MPLPRSATVIPGQSGFFHCYTRCVRRSFLCGVDERTGQSFEHRRQWVVDRLYEITRIFAVDVYSYAVMQNHYHVVLFVEPSRTEDWSDQEVITRWSKVFSWRRMNNDPVKLPDNPSPELIQEWRERLGSLSWIMRCVNEPIARWSNSEDDVTGHFWEGRFNSLPLLDETGLLACMSYADLNPIRAGICIDPADSDYTSIQLRINSQKGEHVDCEHQPHGEESLGPIYSNIEDPQTLGLSINEYIALVYATSEQAIEERRATKRVLKKFKVAIDTWTLVVNNITGVFRTAVGNERAFTSYMRQTKRRRQRDLLGRSYLYS